MKASTFWKTVVSDKSEFLERIFSLLDEAGIKYCVIGGQAVNAYAEPVVSLDLDLAIAADDIPRAIDLLSGHFRSEAFPHSFNLSEPGSDLRLQLQTDERYADFVARAQRHDVLGWDLPVAAAADVLQGKIWAASDPTRRQSKRLKDFADIARILETQPDLTRLVPEDILARIR